METRTRAAQQRLYGSARIDERGDIRDIDAGLAGTLGWPPPLLTGRAFAVLLDPQDAPVHQAHLDWCFRTGREQEYETRLRTAAGQFIATHVLLRSARDGSPVSAIVSGGPQSATPRAITAERRSTPGISGYAMAYLRVDRLSHGGEELPDALRREALETIGVRMASAFRDEDRLVQAGDHEFIASLAHVEALVDAQAAARRLARVSSTPLITRMGPIRPLVSTRIAFFDAIDAA